MDGVCQQQSCCMYELHCLNCKHGLAIPGGTELKILFGEAWLFGVTRQRLGGEVPFAREGNTLCCFGMACSVFAVYLPLSAPAAYG